MRKVWLLGVWLVLALAAYGAACAGVTERVSVSSSGRQGNGDSYASSISADGRYVAFMSDASNLVPGDTNNAYDIFVHDRQNGQTTRVSVSGMGQQGNWDSGEPSISADGRHVAFWSYADNLVAGDTNEACDVFVHDRQSRVTTRASVSSTGLEANDGSGTPVISGDGRFVAFDSAASNLVQGDTNDAYDIFVRDRATGQTTRVSVSSDGSQGNGDGLDPAISADGRYVAYMSDADNLVPGDTNEWGDVFVHDRLTGQTIRASVASDGAEADDQSVDVKISGDGRYVVFKSYACNLAPGCECLEDIYVHDMQTGETTLASVTSDGLPLGACDNAAISGNGRYVVFESGPWDARGVFVHDRQTGQTTRVSVSSGGAYGNWDSYWPSISADGRFVAFESLASNLVPGDTNGTWDVFVRDSWRSAPPSPPPTSWPGSPYDNNAGWNLLRGQLHCHSIRDVDKVPQTNVPYLTFAQQYKDHGFDFVALTNHYDVAPFLPGAPLTWAGPSIELTPDPVFGKVYGCPGHWQNGPHVLAVGMDSRPGCDELWSGVGFRDGDYESVKKRDANVHQRGGLALVAHPCDKTKYYDFSIAAAELRGLYGLGEAYRPDGLGIYNGKSTEAFWDALLSSLGKAAWGFSEEDYHPDPGSDMGMAWVAVPGDTSDSWETIEGKLKAGNYYSYWVDRGVWPPSWGVPRLKVTVDGSGTHPLIRAELRNTDGNPYSVNIIRFIGKNGKKLQSGGGSSATYRCNGTEGYVRVRVWQAVGGGRTLNIASQPISVVKEGSAGGGGWLQARPSATSPELRLRYLQPDEMPNATPPAGYIGDAYDVTTDTGELPPDATLELRQLFIIT